MGCRSALRTRSFNALPHQVPREREFMLGCFTEHIEPPELAFDAIEPRQLGSRAVSHCARIDQSIQRIN